MTKCNSTVMRIVALDQYMTIETSHFRNSEDTASDKLSFCEMKYQKIMARSLPIEVTNGTLEGDIVPGDITFFRLQSTDPEVRSC